MRGKEATPSEQTADDDEALSLLVGSYAASAGIIAQTLMEFYNSDRPYLFVIDDIQKNKQAIYFPHPGTGGSGPGKESLHLLLICFE